MLPYLMPQPSPEFAAIIRVLYKLLSALQGYADLPQRLRHNFRWLLGWVKQRHPTAIAAIIVLSVVNEDT